MWFCELMEVDAMSHSDRHSVKSLFVTGTLVFATMFVSAPLAQCQDAGAPKWGEWLRQFRRDKLLKKPFHNHPEDEVKGLASKLRARELDIPNRIKALKYLSTFHCTKFPEARDMLLKVLHEDKWEPVRYEAAIALRDMFANCACDATEEVTVVDRRRGAPDAGVPKHCACCCDAATLESIAKVAYEVKDNGCTYEPSRRVRQMAVEAIAACGIPCHCRPYKAEPEMGPPAWETDEPVEVKQGGSGEDVPDATNELTPVPSGGDDGGLTLPTPTTSVEPSPIPRLSKVCLVSLKKGQKLTPKSQFAAEYRGRVYNFASQAALEEFNRSPEKYAVAFGGCDPVHFLNTKQVLPGRYLVMHNDKFYMFASEKNFELFKANVDRFTGQPTKTSEIALATPGR